MESRPPRPEDIWDQFIDALDRAGQNGDAQGVRVPAFGSSVLAGRPFGELTRDDVRQLARIAGGFGRSEATILALWTDMRQRLRPQAPKKPRRPPRS